jgi:hypothetical protein
MSTQFLTLHYLKKDMHVQLVTNKFTIITIICRVV